MNIFAGFYLKISKSRFRKEFKPLKQKKKKNYLVSLPDSEVHFVKTLPFLEGLKRKGKVVLLAHKKLESICNFLRARAFEILYYEKTTAIFSKEYNNLKTKLNTRRFQTMIELNTPANLSLPYLVPAETRVCFYDEGTFPYYNIMIKGDIVILNEFFDIKEPHPQKLFSFSAREYNKVLSRLNKHKPVLLVNGGQDIQWEGDKIVVGQTIPFSSPEVYEILYFCDAYTGNEDALFEFAKLFEKRILTA